MVQRRTIKRFFRNIPHTVLKAAKRARLFLRRSSRKFLRLVLSTKHRKTLVSFWQKTKIFLAPLHKRVIGPDSPPALKVVHLLVACCLVTFILFKVLLPYFQPARAAGASWYSSDWSYRKKIALTSDITKIPSSQTNFPMLVSLTDSDLAAHALSDGSDILFTDSDGVTKLDHEIETYNSATGQLIAWVKVPTLSRGGTIYMYYGDSSASNQQNVTDVWSDHNFALVDHFNNVTSTAVHDSSPSGHTGTIGSLTQVATTSAEIGSGVIFKGNSDGSNQITYGTWMTNTSSFTVTAWVNPSSTQNTWANIVDNNHSSVNWVFGEQNVSALNQMGFSSAGNVQLTTAQWQQVAMRITPRPGNKTDFEVFLNGALVKSVLNSGNITITSPNLYVGRWASGGREWHGFMDELRIMTSTPSNDWFAVDYADESSPSTFYSVGDVEQPTSIAVSVASSSAYGMHTSVELAGNIDYLAANPSVKYWFNYGTTASYGSATSKVTISTDGLVTTEVTGLLPNTTYHFQFCASETDGSGQVCSDDATVATNGAWYNYSWRHSKTIRISNAFGNLTNFPVLVSVTDPDLELAQSDGDDFVFTSGDGTTKLSHQIQSWDSTTGKLVAWVKVPSLSSSANTNIDLYYDNPSASDQENATDTWSQNYVRVYHLDDSSGTLTTSDSASSSANGAIHGTVSSVSSPLNGAAFFPGSSSAYITTTATGLPTSNASRSVSAWFFATSSPDTYNGILGWGSTSAGHVLYTLYLNGSGQFETDSGSNSNQLWSVSPVDDSTWHYGELTFNGASEYLYLDGKQIGGVSTTLSTASSQAWIGDFPWSSSNPFTGYIDEVHVANADRSPEWVETEYINQMSSSSFATFSEAEGLFNQPPQVQNVSSTENSDGTVTITYQVRDADAPSSTPANKITPSFAYCAGGTSCSAITALSATSTSSVSVNSDGVTWTSATATWTPTTDFPNTFDSSAEVRVTADDGRAAYNTGMSTSSAFTLDSEGPQSPTLVVDASVTPALLTLSTTDSSTPVTMRIATSTAALNSATYTDFTTTTTLALSDPSTVYVEYKDAYSNTSTALVTTPETPTNPIIQDTSNISSNDYSFFIAWKTVNAPSQGSFGAYKIYRSTDQSTWTQVGTSTERTVNYYVDTTPASSTVYYYKVFSTDSLGDVSFSSNSVNGNADGTQDADEGGGGSVPAPVISNVATSSVASSAATVTWDSDTLSNSMVSYSASPGVFSNTVTVASYVNNADALGQHQVIVAGLSPNTTYYFEVTSVDASGNSTIDNNGGNGYMFTTSNGPTITALPTANSVNNSSAVITWSTSASANSTVVYSSSSDFSTAITSSSLATYDTGHAISLTGLSANTEYFYYVSSTDNSGNVVYDKNVINGTAEYYNFNTTNDNSAPVFSDFSATVSTDQASIVWTTDKLADSELEYGLTSSYGTTTTLDNTLTIKHFTSLTGLSSNTTYHYRALSTDANGNAGTSADQTFTTDATSSTPPVISNVTSTSIALTQATINWNTDKQTNGTVEYGTTDAYGNLAGNLFDFSSSTHSVTLVGLLGNKLYHFRVDSTDDSGNLVTSADYTFTTEADVTPPVISNITELVEQNDVIVQWTTNELAMSEVDYGLASDTLDMVSSVTSTFNTSHAVVLAGLNPNTTYYFQVMSADTSANTTTQDGLSVTTVAYGEVTKTVVVGGGVSNAFVPTSAPVLSGVIAQSQDPFTEIITWNTDSEGTSLVKYGKSSSYGALAGDEINRATAHSVTLIGLDPATTYHYKAESFDAAGNLGASDDITFTTLNLEGEIVSSTPENPDSTVTSPTPTTTTPDNSADEFLLSRVKTATASLLQKVLKSVIVNPAIKDIPQDSIVSTIADITQRVISAPTIVGVHPEVQVHGNNATISWYTDKKTDGIVAYATQDAYKPSSDTPYDTSAADTSPISTVHIVELQNLQQATQYHFQVISKGEIGSETKSSDYVFTTEDVLPELTDVQVVAVKASSADISWKTNIPSASILEYTDLTTKKTLTIGDPTLLVNHTFTIPDLSPGTNYSLVIKAQNESNNTIESKPVYFTTTIDKDAPVITNTSANSTLYPGKDSKVQTIISWKTDEPATSQIYYQEGVAATGVVASTTLDTNFTTDHIMVLTSFKPSTVYKYWIESTDASGNVSRSDSFTMLTPIQKETIIDIIGKNFQSVFGWTKQVTL